MKVKRKLLLIGGGGHCASVIDALDASEYVDIGVIDIKENVGKTIRGYLVIGTDDDLEELFESGYEEAFLCIGSTGNLIRRANVAKRLSKIGFKNPIIRASSAVVSCSAQIHPGVFIGKNAVINASAVIRSGVIVNSGVIVEHDCIVSEHSHLATGAILCGEVKIGEYVHIGAGSMVKQGITIGDWSVIGMGSTVLNDIGKGVVAYGTPCKKIKENIFDC